jgi:signal transduction histidine kinase
MISSRWRKILIQASRLVFAFAITGILTQFSFDYIESFLYDARVRARPAPSPSGHIETIVIDPETIQALGRVPNASDFKSLIERLDRAGSRNIVSLVSPVEAVGSLDETRALAKTAEMTKSFIVALDDVPLSGEKDALKLSPPFDHVRTASAPVPVDRNIFARDDVSRRMMLAYQGLPTLHPLLASELNPKAKEAFGQNDGYTPAAFHGVFEYLKSDQAYVQFAPTGTYKPTSYVEVLRNDATLSRFKDKIVILGRDIQTTSKDYVRTPYSRDIVAMTIVELSANMFDTLIRNDAPKQAPRWLNLLITTMISYLTVLVVLTLTPTTGLLILGSTIGGYFLLSLVAFWLGGWWVDVAHPFLAIFICYYFFIPYRLIIENRRSWEYYQKNKLLTQVEELKTNFLSMMSHDLKTPIARIQGMAEVVRSDKNPLSPTQAEAIDTLRRSSDELLEFISSVLNLGRIESKAIQLHLQSKDVNALLKEVVSKLEYLAGSKNIDIRTELEPLFSIKFDVDLIRQVLSNLVENAIKYSPEKTSILVSSEERDGWIVVQVADQGPGIPEDELPHIFMKFYRSRNAKGSAIKGSGLGLYLAKYFVELHKGRIQVDSTLGQGSTFTVELPAG